MVKSLTVALFKPDLKDAGPINALFQRIPSELHHVASIQEVQSLLSRGDESVDALLVPSRIQGGTPPATICLNLKADRQLAKLPLIVLSHERERESLSSFYNFGADCVFLSPFDSESVRHQIMALVRHHHAYHEALSAELASEGLQDSTIAALDATREALVLLDVDKKLVFVNRSARSLLTFKEQPNSEEWEAFEGMFGSLVPPAVGTKLVSSEGTIKRGDGSSFPSLIHARAMLDREGEIAGYVIRFEDRRRLELLVNNAGMAYRTRGLYLMTAAASLKQLSQSLGQTPLAPLTKIDELLTNDRPTTVLKPLVVSLLEMLDALISPDLKLSVKIETDYTVAMRFSEIFQLAGLLVMHCLEVAGPRGEASLWTEPADSPGGVFLVASAQTPDPFEWEEEDVLMEVVRGKLPIAGNRSTLRFPDLEAADAIAKRHHTRIEYKDSGGKFKLRTKLPLA